ncbi:MAG: hypothetical protein JO295_08655 [Verrucomicrobia bacterium]|nr:hypothetical protein [Verrucomicrobiota bacterium]
MAVPLDFQFPLSTLLSEARLIVSAAQDPAHRDAIAVRLGSRVPGFVNEVDALIDIIENGPLNPDEKPAAVGGMAADIDDLVHRMNDLVRGAKSSARLAFHGENEKLRNDFQIGIRKPNNLAAVIQRARIVANSCAEGHNETALSFEGWMSADTAELTDVVSALENSEAVREAGSLTRVRTTGDRNADANILFADARTIQNAASLVYPSSNPANAAVRASFRLGIFPPSSPAQTKLPGEAPIPNPATP